MTVHKPTTWVLAAIAIGLAAAISSGPRKHPHAVSADAHIELVGQSGGTILGVAVAERPGGHTVYFGIGGRLTAMDADDPVTPRLVSVTTLGDDIHGLAVSGDALFVAAGESGLHSFDISDRMRPRLLAHADTPGTAEAVAVDGSLAYVADGEGGLSIVDVRDPAMPRLLGRLTTARYSRDVVVRGDHAFVSERGDYEAGLWIVDVSDPTAARELAFLDTPSGGDAVALGDRGERSLVYVSAVGGGVWVVDVSDPETPEMVTVFPPPPETPIRETPMPALPVERADDVLLFGDGTLALLASGHQGLRILDVSDPDEPSLVSDHPLQGDAHAVAADRAETRAYVALGPSGLAILDIRIPRSLKGLGRVDLVGQAWDLALAGDHAWVSDRSAGVRAIDVSNPSDPQPVGLHWIEEGAPGPIAIDGDYLFTGIDLGPPKGQEPDAPRWWDAWRGGVNLAYIADPREPIDVITVNREWGVSAVAVDTAATPALVLVTEWAQTLPDSLGHSLGMRVFDRGRSLRLTERGYFELNEPPTDIEVAGNVAFVTSRNRGLLTFDVSDPDEPTPLGYVATPGEALGVAVDGARAYVADGAFGVQVVDAREPRWPHLAGRVDTPGRARRIAPDGHRVWVAALGGGVQLIDASDAFAPRLVDSYRTPGQAHAVVAGDGLAYVAVLEGALVVLRAVDGSPGPPTATATAGSTATANASAATTATITKTPSQSTPTPSSSAPSTPVQPGWTVYLPIAHDALP